MASSISVRGTLNLHIEDFLPRQEDILSALQHQRSRILRRTSAGVDFELRPFAPYNRTRPYYYYPNGRVGKERSKDQLKRDQAAVRRFANKVGRTKGAISRSRLGLKFPSYAAFKLIYLGRSTVDLYGARAPHMLQGITIRAESGTAGTLGIYGDEAKRANGISSEIRPKGMPRRQFFAASEYDQAAMAETIRKRIQRRIDKLSG